MNTFQKNEYERLFYLKLDEKLLGYNLIRPNNFTDILAVTAVKTNRHVNVYFDFLAKQVSFWRDVTDEEFVFPLSEAGIMQMYKAFIDSIKTTYFFDILYENNVISTLSTAIFQPYHDKIIESLYEISKNINQKFDCISVTDFLGNFSKKYKFSNGSFTSL